MQGSKESFAREGYTSSKIYMMIYCSPECSLFLLVKLIKGVHFYKLIKFGIWILDIIGDISLYILYIIYISIYGKLFYYIYILF